MATTSATLEHTALAAKKAVGTWSRPQTALVVGVGAAVLVAGLAWFLLRSPGDYAPLFTNLQPADAAAVVQQLDAQHEPYRLDDQGSTVRVPSADVYRLRLDLAAQGLPNSGTVGFEIMDKLGLASTDFDRQVALLRATQGELERTIEELDGVRSARVHLVMPKDSAFGTQAQPASAAILVEMQPGRDLDARSVQGIVHLVAASVADLKPDQVTVIDQTGRVLSTPVAADVGSVAADGNLALQAKFQQDLQTRLESFLTQIFGPGNVATQVSAQLNFDQTTTETDLFTAPPGSDPQGGLLRSVQELKTSMTGQANTAGGVPGDSNFPTYPAVGGGSQNSTSTQDQFTRNYELNETKTSTRVAPGAVRQLQVSVVVNKQLTPQQQAQVKDIVSAAVGADPARNDVLTVTSMPFDTSLLDSLRGSETAGQPAARAIPLWEYAAAGGAALVLALLALLFVGRRRSAARRAAEEEALAYARAESLREHQVQVTPIEVQDNDGMLDLKSHARQRPDLVARTLRAWMAEE